MRRDRVQFVLKSDVLSSHHSINCSGDFLHISMQMCPEKQEVCLASFSYSLIRRLCLARRTPLCCPSLAHSTDVTRDTTMGSKATHPNEHAGACK